MKPRETSITLTGLKPGKSRSRSGAVRVGESQGEQSKMEHIQANKNLWCNWCPLEETG